HRLVDTADVEAELEPVVGLVGSVRLPETERRFAELDDDEARIALPQRRPPVTLLEPEQPGVELERALEVGDPDDREEALEVRQPALRRRARRTRGARRPCRCAPT